jgi:hypothetical protein
MADFVLDITERDIVETGWYDPKTRTFYSDVSYPPLLSIPAARRCVRLTVTKRQTWDAAGLRWLTDIEPVSVTLEDGTPYPDWPKEN